MESVPLIGSRLVGAVLLLGAGFAAGLLTPRSGDQPPVPAADRRGPVDSNHRPPSIARGDNSLARGVSAERAFRERVAAEPRCPAADRAAAELLAALAAENPARALALALGEPDHDRQALWLHRVLVVWAARAPTEAAAWIDAHPLADRENAESAVVEGAVEAGANEAEALVLDWVRQDPTDARSHANQLLRVLGDRGEFAAAVGFAGMLPSAQRAEAMATAFQYWARSQPERALDAALQLPESPNRADALDGAASGWAAGDPARLAEVAIGVPSPADRTRLLDPALREWVRIDPKAASEWIDQRDAAPELDAGAAAIALQPAVVALRPTVAVEWAESITAPELKSSTLACVVRDWATRDSAAALAYLQTTPFLLATDRRALFDELTRPHPDG